MLTDLEFLQPGKPWPPTHDEYKRKRKMIENKRLFDGEHERVFKENWERLQSTDTADTYEIVFNFHRRLTVLFADLLLGETPTLQTEADDDKLQEIVDRNDFWATSYEIALDVPPYGAGLYRVGLDEDGAKIDAVSPLYWLQVVDPTNIREVKAHVLAWPLERELAVEIHEKGMVTNARYRLAGERIGELLEMEQESTGVDDFLVVPVQNLKTSSEIYGKDDYGDLDSIIAEISLRLAQISRILDHHANPNMYGDERALTQNPQTGEWEFRANAAFFPVSEGGTVPGYITWDGNLDSAFRQIELLMENLYMLSETSPAAFGQLKTGLAESGTALRRLMLAPLARVNRIRSSFDPAIKKVIWLASKLEGGAEIDDLVINWRDGLPDDEKEEVEIATMAYGGGILSLENAVARFQHLEGEELQAEIDRIAEGIETPPEPIPFDFGEE